VLSISGIPGSGKTLLSSHLIEKLRHLHGDTTAIAYHYCDYKDPRSLHPITIVGTLVKSVLGSLDIPDELSDLIANAYKDGQRSPT
jgi:broad-specificity NMP kinase